MAPASSHSAKPIDPEFRRLSETLTGDDTAFYFAYGGCSEEAHNNIRVIDRKFALRWAESENGDLYRRLLLGDVLTLNTLASLPTAA